MGEEHASAGEPASGAIEPARVHVAASPTRCPYCHDACASGEDTLVCDACLARHHRECWTVARRCASCGGSRALGSVSSGVESSRASTILAWTVGALAVASPLLMGPLWELWPTEVPQWLFVLAAPFLLGLVQGAVSRSTRWVFALPLLFMAATTLFMAWANPNVTISVIGILIGFFWIVIGGWTGGALGVALGRWHARRRAPTSGALPLRNEDPLFDEGSDASQLKTQQKKKDEPRVRTD